MIIEFEINGARVIVSGENLSVNVSQDAQPVSRYASPPPQESVLPTPEEIRKFRKAKGMPQYEFCKFFGVNQGTVCKWEKGSQQPHGSAAIILTKMMAEG